MGVANKATGDIKLNDINDGVPGVVVWPCLKGVRASHSVNSVAPSPLGHDFPRKIASVR